MNKIHETVEKKNPGKNLLKQYKDQPHGWTAARGDVSLFLSIDTFTITVIMEGMLILG